MSQPQFRHTVFVYSSDAEYVAAAVDFLRGGLEAGEGALVAAPRRRRALVRRALGPAAEEIGFLDLAAVADRPAKMLAAPWHDIGPLPSLAIILALLTVTIVLSLMKPQVHTI